MVFTLSRTKQVRKVLHKSKKNRCTNIISHVNSNKSNNWNIQKSNNLIGTSNFPHSNVQNVSSYNILITLQKVTDSW